MIEFEPWQPRINVTNIDPMVWEDEEMLSMTVAIVDNAIEKTMDDNKG